MARSAGFEFRCGTADVRAYARSAKISVEMAARDCSAFFFHEDRRRAQRPENRPGTYRKRSGRRSDSENSEGDRSGGYSGDVPGDCGGYHPPTPFATRDSILEYLRGLEIEFRNDSTNFEPFCQRNFLRLKIFPLLREAFHPQIVETIARCADLAREEESWWASEIRTRWGDICLEIVRRPVRPRFGAAETTSPGPCAPDVALRHREGQGQSLQGSAWCTWNL